MKATNNTIINSIMKYICAIVMVLGVSVNAWGGITFSPTSVSVTVSEDDAFGSLLDGTDNLTTITITGSNLSTSSYPPFWYFTGITDGFGSDHEHDIWDIWCDSYLEASPAASFSTTITIGFFAWFTGTYEATLTVGYYDNNNSYQTADLDISVTVSADITTYDVTFNEGSGNTLVVGSSGVNSSTKKISTASMSVLPTATPCDQASDAGWVFDGWKAGGTVSSGSTSYTKVTTPYVPTADVTLYAVYKKKNEELSSSTEYTLQSSLSDLSTSYWMMSCCSDASTLLSDDQHRATNSSPYVILPTSGTYSSSKMTSDAANAVWLITEVTTGIYTFYNVQAEKYLAATATDKELILTTTLNNYAKWSMSGSGDYRYVLNQGRTNAHLHYSAGAWKCTEKASPSSEAYRVRFWKQSKSTIDAKMGTTYQSALSCTETYRVYYEVGCDEEEITSGSIPVDDTEYELYADVAVADNTLTRLGYTFAGWLSSSNGNTYDYNSEYGDNSFAIGNEDVTLTAQWSANTTTIDLNKNCGSGTNGSATVKYDATALATKTDATNSATGYHLEGYYTNDATPVKILSSTGAFANSTISGYVTSGKWSYTTASTLTLYAHWEINTHSLHWYKNDDDADDLTGSYTDGNAIEYGATITAPNTPTFTGHTFEGWSTSSSGSTADPATSMPDNDLTYYAIWSLNHHKLSVAASIANITVTATPSGGSAIAEGSSNASVDYGKSVTLSGTSITAGYAFNHWLVTKDADGSDVTESCVVGNTLTMPDYDVTVTAVMYAKAKLKTRCLQFEVTGDIYLTSTAANEVYTDIAADQITITCEDWGDADKISVTYLNGSGETVAKASSLFRVCDVSTFNYVDATNDYITISSTTSHASGVKYAISYKPGASEYDQLDTWTIRFTAKQSSTTLGHKDLVVHGRALPDKFVVAAKIGGQWCALPADLATSSGTAVQDAYPIQVDNMTTPTTAIAPKTAIYSGVTRNNSAQHRGGVRLQTQVGDSKDGYLQAPRSNSLTYLWRASTNSSKGMQDWYLKSSDFGTYNIALDPSIVVTSGSGDGESEGDGSDPLSRYLCVYSNKIYWGATGAKDFRILPVTEFTPVDVQVVEWASDKIRFMYLSNPDYEAEVKIDNVTKASAAELSTLKIDEGVYEIAVSDLMSSGYKIMHIIIKNGGTEVGRQAVNVPLLVNSTTTVATAAAGFTKGTQCPRMDLVVLSGGKLTAEDATAYQFKSTTVYGGGKLIIDDSKGLNAGTMYLRAGSVNVATKGATPSTSYIYTYPQVYIGSGATLTVSGNIINFDYLTNYDQYFGLALPYPVTLATGIGYPADIYGSAKAGSFLLRTFDSKIRAAQGAVDAVWADIEETNTGSGGSITAQTATTRGLGYYLLSPPRKMSINGGDAVRQKYGIQRLKMDVSSMAENSNASISVTAYPSAQPYNAGWWLLGNPYMANLGGAGVTGTSITVGYLGADASGNAEWKDKSVRYVTVPNDDASETYNQQTVESYTFPAFKPFYVQVGATGTVTFATANRAAAAPKRFTQDGMPAEIATAVALNSTAYGDTTHILIGNVFSDEYEVGDDLMKMPHANVSLFTISNGTDLFSNALNSQSALAGIPVGYTAPDSSRYVFSHVPKADDAWIEHIWLKDKELGLQKDLLEGSYEFDSEASSNKSRFELVIELRTSPSVTTDIENAGEENITQPMKFIHQDHMYILRNGKLYDATGKKVR